MATYTSRDQSRSFRLSCIAMVILVAAISACSPKPMWAPYQHKPEASYLAAGYGGHKLIVLPYRKLVIVHRVNTGAAKRRPMSHQLGRLIWLILAAAGEKDVGPDPSIAAAAGTRLDEADLKQLLRDGCRWMIPNNGLFMGDRHIVIACDKGGNHGVLTI